MTRDTYHSRKSVDIVPGSDIFVRAFITRYEFTIKNSIYFYRTVIIYRNSIYFISCITLCTISLAFILFEELARLDMFRVYHRACQNTAFDDAPTESVYPTLTCTNLPRIDSFRLLSRAIHEISDCLLPIDNRGSLIRLCSSNDSINSHCCSHALYFSLVLSRIACSNRAPIARVVNCAIELINDYLIKSCYFYIHYVRYFY